MLDWQSENKSKDSLFSKSLHGGRNSSPPPPPLFLLSKIKTSISLLKACTSLFIGNLNLLKITSPSYRYDPTTPKIKSTQSNTTCYTHTMNLPSVPEFLNELGATKLPDLIEITEASPLDKVREADIQLFNTQLRLLYACWGKVKTLSQALSLIKTTTEMIEKRRDILGLEYGSVNSKGSKGDYTAPLP